MTLKNFYTIGPDDIETGDVFVAAVTLHVVGKEKDGTLRIRMYRCQHEGDGIPQGTRLDQESELLFSKALFPVTHFINKPVVDY